ncbi:MAG: hypothetical protein HZC36_01885 [Armatimonadetes bacterium]|nr:hypothetical protein [Armatimonadota bacterium]
MNPILTSILLLAISPAHGQTPGPGTVSKFKLAFAGRKSNYPSEKPDPAIQRCMAILAHEAKAKLMAQSADEFAIGEFLLPFLKATGNESYLATDYRVMDVNLADREGLKAVSVTMGAVSRVFVWRDGKAIAMPQRLSWLFGFEAHPYFADCGAMVMNCTSVQDAGMRFGTRAMSIALGPGRAHVTGDVMGEWLLEEEEAPSPFEIQGDRLTLKSLDSPQAVIVGSSDKVFERTEVYAVSMQGLKRLSVSLSMPYLRAADAWMAAAMKARPGTNEQRAFVRDYGREPLMAFGIAEQADPSGASATLSTEAGQFTFFLKKSGSHIEVRGFKFERIK